MAKRNHYYFLFEKNKYHIKNTLTNVKDLLQQSEIKRGFPALLIVAGLLVSC